MNTSGTLRTRMLQRIPADSLEPVELSALTPELSFKPVDLSRWKLLSASVDGETGRSKNILTRVYQVSPSTTLLIVETHVAGSAQGAIAGGTTRLNGRPANLQSIVDDQRRGAAALAWSTDNIFYMLRLWLDETDDLDVIRKIRHIAQEVDASAGK